MSDPKETKPKPKGRPTEYDPSFCEKMITLARKGAFVAEICAELGIRSKSTFYDWQKKYPEFAEAYETAQLWGQAFYEKVGRQMITGEVKGNQHVWSTIMYNKAGDEYKRNAGTHIEINNTTNIAQLSSQELDKQIAELQKKLGNLTTETIEAEYKRLPSEISQGEIFEQ